MIIISVLFIDYERLDESIYESSTCHDVINYQSKDEESSLHGLGVKIRRKGHLTSTMTTWPQSTRSILARERLFIKIGFEFYRFS